MKLSDFVPGKEQHRKRVCDSWLDLINTRDVVRKTELKFYLVLVRNKSEIISKTFHAIYMKC